MTKDEFQIKPSVPPWARSFVNVLHDFNEAHEMDQMRVAKIVAQAKANENNGETREVAFEEQLSYFIKTFLVLIH